MAKFLFIVVPALGHINPTLAVAAELKKRGHTVGYATGTDMQYSIEKEGVHFFPAGPPGIKTGLNERGHTVGHATGTDMQYSIEKEGVHFSPAGPPGVKTGLNETAKKVFKYRGLIGQYFFFKMLMEVTPPTIAALQAVLQQYQPDVLVVDSITLAGGVIAEISKLPWATCSSLPGMIPTRDGPPFTHWGLPPSTNGFVNLAYRLIRDGQKLFFYFFDRDFNRIRSSLGLPALHTGVITSTLSPYLLLIFTCEGFEYKRSDWPSQAHLIGPSPWGKSIDAESSYEWIDALPLDRPIIYVTLGTFQVFRSLNFFQVVMDALQDEPYQVVMSVGPAADIDALRKMAPAGFRIERFVPHERILPRVAAVIHHGGQGIAQDCIYNGIPAVVIPISQDLPEVARRCEVAGVALRIPYSRLTPKRLRTCLRTVLNDTAIQRNTKWLQQIFLNTNAGHTGADLLEQLAAQKRPIYRGTGT